MQRFISAIALTTTLICCQSLVKAESLSDVPEDWSAQEIGLPTTESGDLAILSTGDGGNPNEPETATFDEGLRLLEDTTVEFMEPSSVEGSGGLGIRVRF